MDASILSAQLEADLLTLFSKATTGSGITAAEYAAEMAHLLASDIIGHIKETALVSTVVTGTAGTESVTGSGTGGVT